MDEIEDESSCESHADCQRAFPGLKKDMHTGNEMSMFGSGSSRLSYSYKANDIFLKSCSGNPVRNTVEQPPFNCPLAAATATFDWGNWVIPVVPWIGCAKL